MTMAPPTSHQSRRGGTFSSCVTIIALFSTPGVIVVVDAFVSISRPTTTTTTTTSLSLSLNWERSPHDAGPKPPPAPVPYPFDEDVGRVPIYHMKKQKQNQDERWGIFTPQVEPHLPFTPDEVVDRTFEAIVGTIHGKQKEITVDQSSSSIVSGLSSPYPLRNPWDAGRIGVELNGLETLYNNRRSAEHVTPQQAMRKICLMLAGKLSDSNEWNKNNKKDSSNEPPKRPIVVYFNTIKQTLKAVEELNRLKQLTAPDAYDHVYIQALGDDIPKQMQLDRTQKRRYGGLLNGYIDPARGMILIVQPTDFNSEYRPPGPAATALPALQLLVAKGSLEELPVVVVSPRFHSEHPIHDYFNTDNEGIDEEDARPRGPVPWIVRDFVPPCFSWIVSKQFAMTQTVMERGHPWHLFQLGGGRQYLGSTKGQSGRPTGQVLRYLLEK